MFAYIFKIIATLLLSLGLFSSPVYADDSVNAYLFYGEGCPHCAKEKAYFESIAPQYPQLVLNQYEVYYNSKNNSLLRQVASKLKVNSGGVPFLVIGDKSYIGFAEGVTSKQIENRILECTKNDCPDIVAETQNSATVPTPAPQIPPASPRAESIKVPIFGEIDPSKLSLPLLTFILAFLDGFNPCAMWTLLFLISLLLGMKDRRRMWILGSAFIIASALVYFLFLAAWLNLFLFLGFVTWIRTAIGIIALAAGYYYLKDYCINKAGGCQVMGDEKRQRFFEKIKSITTTRSFVLALFGIIILAFSVNLIELVCSAGLPAIYTQILSLSDLSKWQYYLYLIFYVLIFMLDDLFIFFTAMLTLRAVGIESKYSRLSHLIGGILMLIIGSILILKPGLLMFG